MSLGARNFKVWKTVGRMQERRAFHAVSVNKVDTYTGPTVTFYRLEDVESRVELKKRLLTNSAQHLSPLPSISKVAAELRAVSVIYYLPSTTRSYCNKELKNLNKSFNYMLYPSHT